MLWLELARTRVRIHVRSDLVGRNPLAQLLGELADVLDVVQRGEHREERLLQEGEGR